MIIRMIPRYAPSWTRDSGYNNAVDGSKEDQCERDEHDPARDDGGHGLELAHPVIIGAGPALCHLPEGEVGKERGKDLVCALHGIGKEDDGHGQDRGNNIRDPEDEIDDEADEDGPLLVGKGYPFPRHLLILRAT